MVEDKRRCSYETRRLYEGLALFIIAMILQRIIIAIFIKKSIYKGDWLRYKK